MLLGYGAIAILAWLCYRQLSPAIEPPPDTPPQPLRESRGTVLRLAGVFSVDSFGSGFIVQSMLALWLFENFNLSTATTGTIFFWVGLLSAISYPVAANFGVRFGLLNTMVFTHLPAAILLIVTPFMPSLQLAVACLLLRSLLSQMDVPVRNSYVMAVVTPAERPAAASVTAVPRSLASAIGPLLAGYLLSVTTFGWPLLIGGVLKGSYDLLLLRMFTTVRPPEEQERLAARERGGTGTDRPSTTPDASDSAPPGRGRPDNR
jgi:MFS family permease